MKKTSTIQQKLKAYSAVAGAVVASTAAADAQIIYTDVNPDVTVNTVGGTYSLDLNNDGTVEFVIGYQQIPIQFVSSTYTYDAILAQSPAPTTTFIDTTVAPTDGPWAAAHNANDNIAATNLWSPGLGTNNIHFLAAASTVDPATYSFGPWLGAVDKYLAIKFNIGANTHYGWARLSVGADAKSFVIKDYAYESTANSPILAGAMPASTGINAVSLKSVKVFSFNKVVNVDLGEAKDAVVSIHDMTGREVSSVNLAGGATQIDLSTAADGIYTVSINTVDGRTVSKVAIK